MKLPHAYSPGLRTEAVPGQLQDLEAQTQQDSVLVPYGAHQDPQHHRLRTHTQGHVKHWDWSQIIYNFFLLLK